MQATASFCIALTLALFASSSLAAPQGPPTTRTPVPEALPALPQPADASGRGQLNNADLAAYFDGMLPTAMATGDIAGAAVIVVKDGITIFAQGYGYADVERKTRVTPATLFRPGSISKLFTWTAVMQQVQAGRLNLDEDINKYLDFKIEGFNRQPIKLRHLMTHTAGFEERLLDLVVKDEAHLEPLGKSLKQNIPARIYPPGAVPAYSNYGAALAGYIVERVSGMPFDRYVAQHIFAPLGMEHATFRQPVQPALRAGLSQGYREGSGAPVDFEIIPASPAGALSASTLDMARFMNAHLYEGAPPDLGEAGRILSAETTHLMHARANVVAPAIDAMALGFYEQNRNGYRVIAHGGDTAAFHSDLLLIPVAHVGMYVAFNSVGRNAATYALRTALDEGFMDRYFPRTHAFADEVTPPDTAAHGRAVSGTYELSRRSAENLFSVIFLTSQASAAVDDMGLLEVGGLNNLNDQPKRFREIAPWLWREDGGEMRLQVLRGADGKVTELVPDGYAPTFVMQPVPAWRSKNWLIPALLIATAILLIAAIAWACAALRRNRRSRDVIVTDRQRSVKRLIRYAGLSSFVFSMLLVVLLAAVSSGSFWIFSSSATWLVRLIQLAALLSLVGAFAALFGVVQTWRLPDQSRTRSVAYTLIALSCCVFGYLALTFHFLTPKLVY